MQYAAVAEHESVWLDVGGSTSFEGQPSGSAGGLQEPAAGGPAVGQ